MGWVKTIAKWAGLGILTLLLAGALYQQIGQIYDSTTVPPPGRLVDVDGHRMHVLCSGSGDMTFVLDAGLGAWSVEWARMQPLLARSARVCAIDRPGLGWSDTGLNAFDAGSAADTMAKVVRAAGIRQPFIYVGHSLGANFAEIYAARYPRDVAALVLLEPGVPKDLLEDFHGSPADAMALEPCDATCKVAWLVGYLGIPRLTIRILKPGAVNFAGQPVAMAQYRTGLARSSTAATGAAELAMVPKTAVQVNAVKSFGDLPVLVVASSDPRKPESNETPADVARWRIDQRRYFETLAAKSTRGKGPVVIPHSNHASLVIGPPAIETVAQIVAFARDNGLLLN